jgi:hypothetical protein
MKRYRLNYCEDEAPDDRTGHVRRLAQNLKLIGLNLGL